MTCSETLSEAKVYLGRTMCVLCVCVCILLSISKKKMAWCSHSEITHTVKLKQVKL